MAGEPEVWLRGRVDGFEPLLMPVVHALLQVREELVSLAARVPDEQLWSRPGGAASIGFHIRHTGGALDRLFTYARGEALTQEQKTFLGTEAESGSPPDTVAALVAGASAVIDRALGQLRSTSSADLLTERRVGRAGLPSNTLGLLFHAAEHSTRHAGQAVTTAKILAGSTAMTE
jgi:uncharacterized damage-inducible protein DinB